MNMQNVFETVNREVVEFLSRSNDYRTVLILIASIIISYWLSRFLAQIIIFVAQKIAVRTDTETSEERVMMLRQVETYLSVTVAAVRAIVVAIVAYFTWRLLAPEGSKSIGGSTAAAIGAGTFFIVFAGQTLGILLRDITAGALMIIEKWFAIGDYIKVEPFWDVRGVVEQMSLRSTKLRTISGEIIWIHNQQIQAVHVTPRALRVIAVDIFAKDPDLVSPKIRKIMNAVPTGPTLLARPLRMQEPEKWGDDLWRITIIGETAPGREWLIEQFFVNAVKAIDEDKEAKDKLIVFEPIARFADPVADRKFKRAVRIQRDK